ncbi:MAG: hypothetical protein FVQ84_07120, partial [Planctomycetes bacterium]|nr:hypothetical protein [Planctomycetota bacterium]
MKKKGYKRKTLKAIVIAALIILAVVIFVGYMVGDYLIIHGPVFFGIRDAQRKQASLLYKTDHQALLKACRELSRRVAAGDLKPGEYRIRTYLVPGVSKFPQPILDLKPNYVYIDENDSGRVMIEMHGGFAHFGVLAYTEDYKKPSYSEYGDKDNPVRPWICYPTGRFTRCAVFPEVLV